VSEYRSIPAVCLRKLRKAYNKTVAVDGIDLEVQVGECYGLLGPNGAGKTTTVEICEGLISPDSGDVEVLGLHWNSDTRALRERLGIQLQETEFSDKLSVLETVRLFRSFYRRGPAPGDVIALVQLESKQMSWAGSLSGGEKQRLSLACALVGDPDLVFLDEPTTGLDPQARLQVWHLIEQFKAAGRTIFLTTHYMEEAERVCDRVAIMDRGQVIALGTPRQLIASIEVGHIVEFSAGSAVRELDLSPLRRMDGVSAVQADKGRVRLNVTELHRSVPALLSELARQEVPLTSLSTRSATLEDVFVALTGRQLRDD
jgi:ABC-2 type transport system ATP-binding protein